jgi:hypothetical protein
VHQVTGGTGESKRAGEGEREERDALSVYDHRAPQGIKNGGLQL